MNLWTQVSGNKTSYDSEISNDGENSSTCPTCLLIRIRDPKLIAVMGRPQDLNIYTCKSVKLDLVQHANGGRKHLVVLFWSETSPLLFRAKFLIPSISFQDDRFA